MTMTISSGEAGREWRILWPAVLLLAALGNLPSRDHERFLRAARNPDPNRADLEAGSGGYYVGLIDGGAEARGTAKSSWGDLSPLLLGKPANWVRFADAGVATPNFKDFLQFRLNPNVSRDLYGREFSTNSLGMRDRHYALEKPPGAFRIALLGSSIDMGWGVGDSEVYEHRWETWLNAKASASAIAKTFEVLNFAVAAYGPAQRLDIFEREARRFQPDLVIYSATMLDPRLAELHLRGLLAHKTDLRYEFIREIAAEYQIAIQTSPKNEARLTRKDGGKLDLAELSWALADRSIGELAQRCRATKTPIWMTIVPRVGPADAPGLRERAVKRYHEIAERRGIPLLDLSDTFDGRSRSRLEIAAWDDHPNTEGHQLLFREMKRLIEARPELSRVLFGDHASLSGAR